MTVGDLVKVTLESGYIIGLGLVVDVYEDLTMGGFVYEVACQETQTICIATEDMLEVLNAGR